MIARDFTKRFERKESPSLSMKTSAVEGKSSELSPWYHFPNLLIKYPLAFWDLKLTPTYSNLSLKLFRHLLYETSYFFGTFFFS